MNIALVGLGKMGLNMALRLLRGGHRVVVHNRSQGPVERAKEEGAEEAAELADLRPLLDAPRTVWTMLPAGGVTDKYLRQLYDVLDEGDLLVEGATRITATRSAAPARRSSTASASWMPA